MREYLQTLLHDFGWIHRGIGMIGNLTFVLGSILFLPSFSSLQTIGVWLFIGGSALMFIGALGEFVVSLPGSGGGKKAARIDCASAGAGPRLLP
ncbi:MAG: hypothetical protein CL575_02535 [Altererythrobacter sp.]|nr:hypothetical protein [Altererythrobacter sp.]